MNCIYAIKNKITRKMYIGQSTNIKNRFTRHKSLLKRQKHWNIHLQRACNKYGLDNFEFIILAENVENLSIEERNWIVLIGEDSVYNLDLHPETKMGSNNMWAGKKHTASTKIKMQEAKQGKYFGKSNPNYGNKWSQESKSKMMGEKNPNCKLSTEDVIKIKHLIDLGSKHSDIANQFGITRSTVTKINLGKLRKGE